MRALISAYVSERPQQRGARSLHLAVGTLAPAYDRPPVLAR
jgi:hypothetical protein